jgi:hypothetical protein
MQNLLDVCNTWSRENGITFAPKICAILAVDLFLYNERVPVVYSFNYVGHIRNQLGKGYREKN